ncbi:Phosphatidylinositol kinase [Actinidia chinensis var. chinensis]|uniref:Phosphatidylinositol kinase n=1 Tax=Actinidia chinensis var. chinensis TaxID=1590841 RepID=A0A2R6PVR4_ACTCC|nr:Phosphatidylinositol kinase [Actinidia chinensis var. chinensis]
MLKIFKNHAAKASLLDDFMYYENRQKIMQEEKTKLLVKSYGSSFLIPALDPPRKQNFIFDTSYNDEEKTNKPIVLSTPKKLWTLSLGRFLWILMPAAYLLPRKARSMRLL